tara:strand:+ start:390 stop:602 length:213 start_codon:yes stop_codon:yes gene_type:complete
MVSEKFKGKTTDELKDELFNLRKESFNLRFQKVSGQLENTARVRQVKKEIARVKTALRSLANLTEGSENA